MQRLNIEPFKIRICVYCLIFMLLFPSSLNPAPLVIIHNWGLWPKSSKAKYVSFKILKLYFPVYKIDSWSRASRFIGCIIFCFNYFLCSPLFLLFVFFSYTRILQLVASNYLLMHLCTPTFSFVALSKYNLKLYCTVHTVYITYVCFHHTPPLLFCMYLIASCLNLIFL